MKRKREVDYTIEYENRKVYAEFYSFFGNHYCGAATCSPNDVFDAKIGREIALARAEIKQLKAVNERNYKRLIDLQQKQERILRKIDKDNNKIKQRQATISKYKGE